MAKKIKYWCTKEEWNKMEIKPDDIQGTEDQVWMVKMLHRVWRGEQSASLSPMEDVTKFIMTEAKRTFKK